MTADCNPSLCKSAEKRRGRAGRQSIRAEQQADIFVCSLGYGVACGGNWTRIDSALARPNRLWALFDGAFDVSHCPFPHRIYTFQGVSSALLSVPLGCASRMCLYCKVFASWWCLRGRLGGVSPAYQALQTDPGRRQGSAGRGQGFLCVHLHIAGSLAPSPSLTAVRRKAQPKSP